MEHEKQVILERFFRHGPIIYVSFLVSGVVMTMASGVTQLSLFIPGLSLLYLAGNLKFAHGIFFNEGVLKRYNQLLCLGFNLACAFTLFEFA